MRMAGTIAMILVLAGGPSAVGWAADAPLEATVVVEHQTFSPAEIRVKARVPFILVVHNRDKVSARFESQSLKIEKIVPAGQTMRIRIPALAPGPYPFGKGRIVAE